MSLLENLPPPGNHRLGWPWTEESGPPSKGTQENLDWPRISIVIPSFNQGKFIEETIRSVLLQNYPKVELLIMDGGSTDESVEIIRKYSPWLDYWVSEKDEGQSHAINSGISEATGVIVNWLCSDDIFKKEALFHIAKAYQEHPNAVAWAGKCDFIREGGETFHTAVPTVGSKFDFAKWGSGLTDSSSNAWVAQPSCFFSRQAFIEVGGVNEDLHYTMDVELWMKLAERGPFEAIDSTISCIRWYPEIKTLQDYPGRMTEHVALNWNLGEIDAAKYKLVEFGQRYSRDYFLSMNTKSVIILLATWVYRKVFRR